MPSNTKKRVRARQEKTGESYQAALQQIRGPGKSAATPEGLWVKIVGYGGSRQVTPTLGVGFTEEESLKDYREKFSKGEIVEHLTLEFPSGERFNVPAPDLAIAEYVKEMSVTRISEQDTTQFSKWVSASLGDPNVSVANHTVEVTDVGSGLSCQVDAPYAPFLVGLQLIDATEHLTAGHLRYYFFQYGKMVTRLWVNSRAAMELSACPEFDSNRSLFMPDKLLEMRRQGIIGTLWGAQVRLMESTKGAGRSLVIIYDTDGDDDLTAQGVHPTKQTFHLP